jgi:hypothetical protein
MSLEGQARALIRRSKGGRKKAQLITDIGSEPREFVGLHVAAVFLGLSDEATRRRLDDGRLRGFRDGRVWWISVEGLRDYRLARSA